MSIAPAWAGGNGEEGQQLITQAYRNGPFGQTEGNPVAQTTVAISLGIATVATVGAVGVGVYQVATGNVIQWNGVIQQGPNFVDQLQAGFQAFDEMLSDLFGRQGQGGQNPAPPENPVPEPAPLTPAQREITASLGRLQEMRRIMARLEAAHLRAIERNLPVTEQLARQAIYNQAQRIAAEEAWFEFLLGGLP